MTRRRKTLVIILGILVAVAVAARVLLGIYAPDIVRALVEQAVRDNTDARLELGDVAVEGLRTIALRDLRLTDPADGGREVLYVEKVEIALAGIPWTGREVRLSKVRVERARAMAVVERDPLTGERRTNFQRFLHPRPSDRRVVVERVDVEGADLRMLFPGMGEPAAEDTAGAGEPDDEAQPDPLVELRDVALALRLTDEAALSYEASLRVGDEAWGPAAFDGIASARPLAVVLSGAGGGIKLTPRTLATLPGVTPGMLEPLQPEAELRLGSLRVSPGAKVTADVTLAGVAVSPPAVERVEGAELGVQLAGRTLRVRPQKMPPLKVAGVGDVADLTFTATLDLDTFALKLDDVGAQLLGGRIGGDVAVPDLRAATPVPEGALTFGGVGYRAAGSPAALTAGGRVTFGPVALDGGHAGLRIALEKTTVGVQRAAAESGGEAQTDAPRGTLELPVSAEVTVDLDAPSAPVAFKASVGDDAAPLRLDVAGRYDAATGVAEFDKSEGQVVLTSRTLAKMAGLGPAAEAAHKAALAGTITFGIHKGTRLPMRNPLAVTGIMHLQCDPLAFTLPGSREPGTARIVASAKNDDADPRVPRLGFRTDVAVQRLDKPGLVQAHLLLDPEGRLVFASAEVQRAEVSDAALKALRNLDALPENVRAAIAALPAFTVSLSGEAEAPFADWRPKEVRGHLTAAFAGGPATPATPATVALESVRFAPADGSASAALRAKEMPLTDGLVRALRPAAVAARPELAQTIDQAMERLPRFAASLSGQAKIERGPDGAVAVPEADADMTIAEAVVRAADDIDVPLTGGLNAQMKGDLLACTLDARVFGGWRVVTLRRTADRAELVVREPGDDPQGGGMPLPPVKPEDVAFRFEALPQALRDKMPQLVSGRFGVTARAEAADLKGLLVAPVAFQADLHDGRLDLSGGAEGRGHISDIGASASGTLHLRERQVTGLVARVGRLQYEDYPELGNTYGTAALRADRLDLDGDVVRGRFALERSPRPPLVTCSVAYDRTTGRLALGDVDIGLDGASPFRVPMPEREDMRTELGGQLRMVGTVAVETRGSPAASAEYDLRVTAKDLVVRRVPRYASTARPQPSAPLDAEITLRRKTPADAHNLTFVTTDGDYGAADVRAGYLPGRVTVRATFKDFILDPRLAALAGVASPKLAACRPSGLLDGTATAALVRDEAGAWKVAELGGEFTGRNLSANCPTGDLRFTGGLLKAKLAPEKVTLETLEGSLANGELKLSGDLLPASPEGDWVVEGGKLSLVRAELRQFQGIAHRPPNELNGRLTVDMASQEAFGFSGSLADLTQLKGRGHASFGEGHLWQLPMFQVLRGKLFEGVAALLRGKFDPTSFRTAETDFLIADGKLTLPAHDNAEGLSPATIDSDLVRMVIDGDVHFDGRLDLHVASGIRADLARGGGLTDLIPSFGKEWDRFKEILEQVPGGEIPIIFGFWHVTGTFDKPNPQPDAGRTLKKLFGSGLEFLKRKDAPAPQPGR